MTNPSLPDLESLPPEVQLRINEVCVRFEDAWLAGTEPRIEDFHADFSGGPYESYLVIQLILLDVDYRRQRGESPDIDEYAARFPALTRAWLENEWAPTLTRATPSDSLEKSTAEMLRERDSVVVDHGTGLFADHDSIPPRVPGCVLKKGEENVKFGGMGVVYFGTELALGRSVAVKVLRKGFARNKELLARFEAEARVNAQLQHPGIVPVHQIGKLDDGRPFYTMKRVRGETFSDLLKKRSSPSADLLFILGQFRRVCEAMAYAHAHNVLHRDLKPANVMVGDYGEVLLMDWGLAKVLGETTANAEQTPDLASRAIDLGSGADREATKGGLGTIQYMAPEQAQGLVDDVDKRSDVFGLGAILCTILTGRPPYIGADARAVERKALRGDLEESQERLAECGADAELTALARKCLSPRREDRPADAGEVAAAVSAYLVGVEERRRQAELDLVQAEAETAKAEVVAREQKKRRRVQLRLTIAIGFFLLIGGGWAWWNDRQAAERCAEAVSRLGRNTETLEGLVGVCEEALRAGDADRARAALTEAERRVVDGGGELLAERLAQCSSDLDILTALDAIDNLKWTLPEDVDIGRKKVIARKKVAFEKIGVRTDGLSTDESARRVTDSLVKDRLLGALDIWLYFEPSDGVRAILGIADPDQFREAIRDTILTGDRESMAELVERKEATQQPAWYAAVLGQNDSIWPARQRELLKAALRSHPSDLTLLMRLGLTYRTNVQDGAEERLRWFQAAVACHPGSEAAHTNLGNALFDKGEFQEAIQAYRAAIAINPIIGTSHNNLGNALIQISDVEGAIPEYQLAIELDAKEALPHIGMGNALQAKGEYAKAIRQYQLAIDLEPNVAMPHNNMGNALLAKGDLPSAIRKFQDAIDLNPKFALPHIGMGNALQEKKEFDKAIRQYQLAIDIDPKLAMPHNNMGNALLAKGDLSPAIRKFQDAIDLNPKFALPHIGMGNALQAKREFDKAIRQYQLAIGIDPKLVMPHNNMGNALLAKGDLTHAIRKFQDAIDLDSKFALPHIGLGNALQQKREFENAIRHYQLAIDIDPKKAMTHNNMGNALLLKGDVERAIQKYQDAIDLNPKYALAHYNMGRALTGRDVERTIQAFQRAIEIDPKFLPSYNDLSMLLAERGNTFAALRLLRGALVVDSSFIEYENVRYNLACCACLAASGRAKDEPVYVDRSGLRREAMGWLKNELTVHRSRAAKKDGNRQAVHETMQHWLTDTDLDSVRDGTKLPENERAEWAKFWAEVRKLRDETAPRELAPLPRAVK